MNDRRQTGWDWFDAEVAHIMTDDLITSAREIAFSPASVHRLFVRVQD